MRSKKYHDPSAYRVYKRDKTRPNDLAGSFERLADGIAVDKYHYSHPRVSRIKLFLSNRRKYLVWMDYRKQRKQKRMKIKDLRGITLGPESSTFQLFKAKCETKER
jgi:hypothetical protein